METRSVTISVHVSLQRRRNILLACNGGSQLVSAIAAAQNLKAWQDARRYLVVHDLNAPGEQAEEFFQVIMRMARSAGRWERILHLKPNEVKSLSRQHPKIASKHLRQRVGVEHVDELYIDQAPTASNRSLLNAYHHAKNKVCFGDGIGVNFAKDYFPTQKRVGRFGMRKLFRTVKSTLSRHSYEAAARRYVGAFDQHCLLLPNLFDQQLSNCVKLEAQEFKQLLVSFESALNGESDSARRKLTFCSTTASQRIILLTANLSESGMMSLPDELTAYREFVESLQPSKKDLLILKPHPRDSRDKIKQLTQLLKPLFRELSSLQDPNLFYIPFEVLFAKYLTPQATSQCVTRIAGVSTALLSLAYLYGLPVNVGFGEHVVRQRFHSNWVDFRLRHERDLQSACNALRMASCETPKLAYAHLARAA